MTPHFEITLQGEKKFLEKKLRNWELCIILILYEKFIY